MEEDVQIPRWLAKRPGLALARKADAVAGIHPARNGDFELLRLVDPAFAMAGLARPLDHLAPALTGGAGALDHEKALLRPHLAMAATHGAAPLAGAGFGALAAAGFALLGNVYRYLDGFAVEGIVQPDFKVIAQIRPAPRLLLATAAKGIAEDRFENIADVGKAFAAAKAAPRLPATAVFIGLVAKTVISGALLRVFQALIGLAYRLEPGFAILAAGVAIRVKLHRQLAIGRFEHALVGIAGHLQQFVEIDFG